MHDITSAERREVARILEGITRALRRVAEENPAASNRVLPPSPTDQRLRVLQELELADAPGVRAFYEACGGLELPDVRNGYFVHELKLVRNAARLGPARISPPWDLSILVVGSDGGGGLFALDRRTGRQVLHLAPAKVAGMIYEAAEGGVKAVAGDWLSFLDRIQQDTAAYADRRSDWSYMV